MNLMLKNSYKDFSAFPTRAGSNQAISAAATIRESLGYNGEELKGNGKQKTLGDW